MANRSKDPVKAATRVYNDYRANCRRRNIFFELTKEDIAELTQKNCYYCDKKPSNLRKGYTYNGIDRIDHNKGYIKDNCLTSCAECNGIRSNKLTVEEMQAVAKALLKFRLSQAG